MLVHGFLIALVIYYGIDMTDVLNWDQFETETEPLPKYSEDNIIATKFIPNTTDLECVRHCYYSHRCHYCTVQWNTRECQLIQVDL